MVGLEANRNESPGKWCFLVEIYRFKLWKGCF